MRRKKVHKPQIKRKSSTPSIIEGGEGESRDTRLAISCDGNGGKGGERP